ncbi:MAG: hypothetical protein VW683_04460 [Betaproteobacteria bacterium]
MGLSSDFSSDLIVVDDFLSKNDLKELQELMASVSSSKQVLYSPSVVLGDDMFNPKEKETHNFQMCHDFKELNTLWILEKFFYERVGILFLERAKANLTFWTDRIVEHGLHVDLGDLGFERGEVIKCNLSHVPIKTACFYLNTCDGYTVFENGEKIQSVENRYVEFDRTLKHSGTTTTDAAFRSVINLNYVPTNLFPRIKHYRY